MSDRTSPGTLWLHMLAGFVLALFLAWPSFASASDTAVSRAVEARDIAALETLAVQAPTAEERALANGTALALRHKDEAALAVLVALAQSGADKNLRADACQMAAEVYLRQGRFAEAGSALENAKALSDKPLEASTLQTLDFVSVLKGVKPMTVIQPASGKLPITHALGALVSVPITVNGVGEVAIVDSGAGFSTVSEATAKRMGLHMLEGRSTVSSSSKEAVATRLGVADRLQFGNAVLTNVVFIVLPDEALTFMNGKFKINAIIGLPVFEAVGRIEFAKENGAEFLYVGPRPGGEGPANLLLAGVEPIVLAGTDQPGVTLRLFLDTGAWSTTLNSRFAKDYPALAATADRSAVTIVGAGGAARDEGAAKLPRLTLVVAGRSFPLEKVILYSKEEPDRHGTIGQDMLKQGSHWVLDFQNMRFSVSD